MKKQELIHLHGLLSELRLHIESRGVRVDVEGYEEEGVRPSSIHKSKTDHKDAVFSLAGALSDAKRRVEERQEEYMALPLYDHAVSEGYEQTIDREYVLDELYGSSDRKARVVEHFSAD